MKNLVKKLLSMVLIMSMVLTVPLSVCAKEDEPPVIKLKSYNTYDTVTLKWTDIGVDEYYVFGRNTTKGEEFTTIERTSNNFVTIHPSNLKCNYEYFVTADTTDGWLVESNTVKVYFKPSKKNPTIKVTKANKSGSKVNISWSKVGTYGYKLYMKKSGGEWEVIGTFTSDTRKETVKLKKKGTYYFSVRPYCLSDTKVVLGGKEPSKTSIDNKTKAKYKYK